MDERTSKRDYFRPYDCLLQARNAERVCSGICMASFTTRPELGDKIVRTIQNEIISEVKKC